LAGKILCKAMADSGVEGKDSRRRKSKTEMEIEEIEREKIKKKNGYVSWW